MSLLILHHQYWTFPKYEFFYASTIQYMRCVSKHNIHLHVCYLTQILAFNRRNIGKGWRGKRAGIHKALHYMSMDLLKNLTQKQTVRLKYFFFNKCRNSNFINNNYVVIMIFEILFIIESSKLELLLLFYLHFFVKIRSCFCHFHFLFFT